MKLWLHNLSLRIQIVWIKFKTWLLLRKSERLRVQIERERRGK